MSSELWNTLSSYFQILCDEVLQCRFNYFCWIDFSLDILYFSWSLSISLSILESLIPNSNIWIIPEAASINTFISIISHFFLLLLSMFNNFFFLLCPILQMKGYRGPGLGCLLQRTSSLIVYIFWVMVLGLIKPSHLVFPLLLQNNLFY